MQVGKLGDLRADFDRIKQTARTSLVLELSRYLLSSSSSSEVRDDGDDDGEMRRARDGMHCVGVLGSDLQSELLQSFYKQQVMMMMMMMMMMIMIVTMMIMMMMTMTMMIWTTMMVDDMMTLMKA